MENRKTWTSKNWIPPASFVLLPVTALVTSSRSAMTFPSTAPSLSQKTDRSQPYDTRLPFGEAADPAHPSTPTLKFSFAGA